MLISGCCVLSQIGQNEQSYMVMVLIVTKFSRVIWLCSSAELIPRAMDKLFDAIEKQASNHTTELPLQEITCILRMRNSVGFTASGFFKIRSSTLLIILSCI